MITPSTLLNTKELQFASVIVPVFSGSEHLKDCIEALQSQTYPKDLYEILIVDNGTQNERNQPFSFPESVKVLYEEFPSSYAARNRGIGAASGEVIAFTDVDCLPSPEWLMKGVEALSADARIGYVGGRIEMFAAHPDRLTLVELFETFEAFNQEKYVKQWGFAATANMFAKKSVFEKVGLFDPQLKSSGDRDWGNRATLAGYSGEYSDNAVVRHAARRSFPEFFRKCARIQGGLYDLHRRDAGTSGIKQLSELWKGWPNQKNFRNLFHNKSHTPAVKVKMGFMYLIYKIFRTVELGRLLRGGVSRRV